MKASELVFALRSLIERHGDKDVAVDDRYSLAPIDQVDESAEEDDCFVIFTE